MRGPEFWIALKVHDRKAIIAGYDTRLRELKREGVPPESPERTALIANRRRLSAEQGVDKGTLRRNGTSYRKQPSQRVA
ncbi:MAG: hypothetical protein M1405_02690 [Patescibacteria group bacterium]|nr:hypothetical protein [Patescibacteria group bacterium]